MEVIDYDLVVNITKYAGHLSNQIGLSRMPHECG